MPNQEYRHEYKFLINESDASALKSRLAVFMRRDAFHTESGGRYTVRSLFSYLPRSLGFSQTAAVLGYEDYFDSSSLMRVDVTADAADWQAMLDNAASEEYIECDIALNCESVSSAGIRCKGNSSLSMTQDERYSFKINFGEYVKKQTFHGLDKMVLNNTQSDNTFIKEYLSCYLLNRAGAKTPLFAMAEIYVNGEYWGLYLAVECIDDAFIERNFSTDGGFLYKPDGTGGMGGGRSGDQDDGFSDFTPPDGFNMGDNAQNDETASDGTTPPDKPNDSADASAQTDGSTSNAPTPSDLPDGDFSDFTPPDENGGGFGGFGGSAQSAAALGYLGDDTSLYGDIFDYAKTNDPSDADKTRLIASLKAISEGELDSALDVDGAISWLAANALLVNDDGYLGNMLHNYFLYELNGRLTILSWDYNLAFGGFAGGSATSAVNDPIDTPSSSERPLVTALLSDEDCLERYHNILYELAAFLTDGSMDALIDELTAMIDESVQNDPTKECTYEDYLTAIETLRSFCTLRGESILGQLNGSIPSTTAGQSEASSALIQADFALSGMGAQGGGKGGFGNFNGFDQSAFGGDRPNVPNGQNDDRLSPPDKTNDGAESSSNSNDAQTADGQTPPDRPDNDGAAPNADGDPAAPQTSNSADAVADAPLPDGTGDSDEDPAEDATAATTPSDETGDTQQTADSRQGRRAPNGMSFGAQSEQAVTGAPTAYAAVLDGAAVIALIAALILITRRRR